MAKKTGEKRPADVLRILTDELKADFDRYRRIHKDGCSDPTWEDGVNLNLVRNHILGGIEKIRRHCEEHNLPEPEICQRPVPDEIDDKYMAHADEIRAKAAEMLQGMRDDPNLDYLAHLDFEPADRELKARLESLLGRLRCFEKAVADDDLVYLRLRLRHPDTEEHAKMAERLRNLPEDETVRKPAPKPVQMSLF